jgi:hypothetical protein
MKFALFALLLALIPTQALAGVACRGGAERGSSAFFFQPIGRERPTGDDVNLDQGTYILDKLCYDNGNLTLVYMEQEASDDFYYLTLTPEVRNFVQSLNLD